MINKELLDYFKGDELAANAWLSKYAIKELNGNIKENHPNQMFSRMAKEYARIDANYREKVLDNMLKLSDQGKDRYYVFKSESKETLERFLTSKYYNLFKDWRYIINGGSVMTGLGNPYYLGSLSNCFVIGQPDDNYGSIMLKRTEQANLMKRRGGVGKDLSLLRPKGALVNNAALSSTGPVSFMDVDSDITNEVAQGGRRGALMLTIDIRHPDSVDFISKKEDTSKVTGANISVKIPNDFMDAVENDEDYILRFPCSMKIKQSEINNYNQLPYNKLLNTGLGCYIKKIKAKELWDKLIHYSWKSAEPGIIFIDNHHNYSPDGLYPQYQGVTTNPCGKLFCLK